VWHLMTWAPRRSSHQRVVKVSHPFNTIATAPNIPNVVMPTHRAEEGRLFVTWGDLAAPPPAARARGFGNRALVPNENPGADGRRDRVCFPTALSGHHGNTPTHPHTHPHTHTHTHTGKGHNQHRCESVR